MQKDFDRLGDIIKDSRLNQKLTREQLSEKINITTRYLMSIENEKPSYDVLLHLIRELDISADKIFYPENTISQSEQEQLLLLLNRCDRHELNVIIATIRALSEKE
jgi:transcriptional regulator with XRE-family HTH domain